MSADASGLHSLGHDLTKAGAKAQNMAREAVAKTAADITGDAKQFAPVDTGNLKSSIGHDLSNAGGESSAEIGPTASYGPFWSGARQRWHRNRSSVRRLTGVSLALSRQWQNSSKGFCDG